MQDCMKLVCLKNGPSATQNRRGKPKKMTSEMRASETSPEQARRSHERRAMSENTFAKIYARPHTHRLQAGRSPCREPTGEAPTRETRVARCVHIPSASVSVVSATMCRVYACRTPLLAAYRPRYHGCSAMSAMRARVSWLCVAPSRRY